MAASTPDAHPGGETNPKMPDLAALQNLQNLHALPDWLMKKEGILLVLKYWQERSACAENELQTLKNQLDSVHRVQNKENNNDNNKVENINALNNNLLLHQHHGHPTGATTPASHAEENGVMSVESVESCCDRDSPLEAKPFAKDIDTTKLEQDISRIRSAISESQRGAPPSVEMQELADKIEARDRELLNIKHEQESRLESSEEFRRDLVNSREFRGVLDPVSLGIHPRSLDGLLLDRAKLDQEMKSADFGSPLSHLGHNPFSQPLRPHIHPQLGTHLPPPPLIGGGYPLVSHPPPGTPFHHLLNEEWRRTLGRSAAERSVLSSGHLSPEQRSLVNNHSDRGDSRDSPLGVDSAMKSPSSMPNGFLPDTKSPFHQQENRSPFGDETPHYGGYKFEDRITGETLIPKGDPMEARLQEILRYNMEKYCHQNLDTLHISRRVRELLSIHNVGQRIFAKYVLGLSQGTVSELLSKPKSWDKLTEKGRDSYRKMHAWATDDGAVFLLKSLIPKKGGHKECVRGTSDENTADDRIQHILTEATRVMANSDMGSNQIPRSLPVKMPCHPKLPSGIPQQQNLPPTSAAIDQDTRSTDSKSPASSTHSPSPISRDGRRQRKDMEELPQDKVAKLYQEEIMKLMSRQAHQDHPSLPIQRETQYPNLLFPFLGQSLLFNRSPDEMRLVLDAYHHELSKIQGVPNAAMGLGAAGLGIGLPSSNGNNIRLGLGGTPPISMGLSLGAGGHNGAEDLSLPKRDHRSSEEEDESVVRISSVGSPFGLAKLKTEPSISGSAGSPLSNIVTPINSISSMTSVSNTSNGSMEETISTTASPLQRMASITNSLMTGPSLSGSSPLAQRPMKAVLPPITQQQFDQYSSLNTEDIVKRVKEQLSQYSISQRLFGESVLGLSQGSVSDLLARPKPWHMLTQKGREPFIRMKIFLEDEGAVHKLVASQYKISPEKLMRTGGYGAPPSITSKIHHVKLTTDLPKTSMESPLPAVGIPSSLALSMPVHHHPHHGFERHLPYLEPLRKAFPLQPHPAMGMRNPGMGPSSVYELAALTQDLDTQGITTKIKEALLANNIGQKLFGETILGLSQGSVSELLSKPKPWHMLSIKGREPFIRMHMWMTDPTNIEKLQQLKNQRREATKRRRALDPTIDFSQDSEDLFQVPSPGGSSKKARVLFSEEQKEAMRIAFNLDPYPNLGAIEFLSQELHLSSRTITNWFHNHRMRMKQQSGSPNSDIHSPTSEMSSLSQNQFDPIQFRIILSQRLMELRKEKGLPSSIPGLGPSLHPGLHPGLFPHLSPFSIANLNFPHGDPYNSLSGLDLSMKGDQDPDDSSASFGDEDSNMSTAFSAVGNCSEGEDCAGGRTSRASSSPVNRPSSRRKPAAPQWVNPSWISAAIDKEQEVINGVCVMQTDDYRHDREQETVLIEPTPVSDDSKRSPLNPPSPRAERGSAERLSVSSPTMDTSSADKDPSCQDELRRYADSLHDETLEEKLNPGKVSADMHSPHELSANE